MNKEAVIALAREAGLVGREPKPWGHREALERFAALVAAHEREECARVCEARYMGDNNREDMEAKRCAAAIRSRT